MLESVENVCDGTETVPETVNRLPFASTTPPMELLAEREPKKLLADTLPDPLMSPVSLNPEERSKLVPAMPLAAPIRVLFSVTPPMELLAESEPKKLLADTLPDPLISPVTLRPADRSKLVPTIPFAALIRVLFSVTPPILLLVLSVVPVIVPP